MILAAGLGTRLKDLTQNKPKALIELNGITFLEHQINYLSYHGINDIIINVHHHSQLIKDLIKTRSWKANIFISDETEKLLDTGGGLIKASWFFNDNKPFVLTAVDVFTDFNLNEIIEFQNKTNCLATLLVNKRKSSRYLLADNDNNLCGWKSVENSELILTRNIKNQDLQEYGFCAIHVISPKIFNFKPSEEIFSIINWYLKLSETSHIKLYENSSQWYEIGKKENLDNENFINDVKKIIAKYKNK